MGTDKRDRQKENRRLRLEEEARAYKRAQRRRQLVTFGTIAVVTLVLWGGYQLLAGDDNEAAAPDVTTPANTTLPDSGSTATVPPAGASITGETPCPAFDGSTPRATSFEQAPTNCLDPTKSYQAVVETTEGDIVVDLDTTNTPDTANNFAVLALYGYYDDTLIHRTDPSIEIIQGGSPNTNDASDPGPGYTITDEGSGFTYEPGDLVMARSPGPDSAGAQFFFVAGDAAKSLEGDGSFVVFGNTTESLDVVQAVLALHEPDPTSGLGGAPSRDVTVTGVRIVEVTP